MVEQSAQKSRLNFDIIPSPRAPQGSALDLYTQAADDDARAEVLNTQLVRTEPGSGAMVQATEESVAALAALVAADADSQGYLADPIRFLSGRNLVAVAQALVDEPITVVAGVDEAMTSQLEQLAEEAGLKVSRTTLASDAESSILSDEVFRRIADELAGSGWDTADRREMIATLDDPGSLRLLIEIKLNHPEALRSVIDNLHEFDPEVRNLIEKVVMADLGTDPDLDLDEFSPELRDLVEKVVMTDLGTDPDPDDDS